jgi:hypothetical protein
MFERTLDELSYLEATNARMVNKCLQLRAKMIAQAKYDQDRLKIAEARIVELGWGAGIINIKKERNMDIEKLTLGELREIARIAGSPCRDNTPLPVGKNVIVRCVTHYHTGRLARVTGGFLILEDAAWIADAGRWATTLERGAESLKEVEPFPAGEVFVALSGVIDVAEWQHELPREQK